MTLARWADATVLVGEHGGVLEQAPGSIWSRRTPAFQSAVRPARAAATRTSSRNAPRSRSRSGVTLTVSSRLFSLGAKRPAGSGSSRPRKKYTLTYSFAQTVGKQSRLHDPERENLPIGPG